MIWYEMIWYDVIWVNMMWYDMIWYGMILFFSFISWQTIQFWFFFLPIFLFPKPPSISQFLSHSLFLSIFHSFIPYSCPFYLYLLHFYRSYYLFISILNRRETVRSFIMSFLPFFLSFFLIFFLSTLLPFFLL